MFIAQHIVISVESKTPCFYGHTPLDIVLAISEKLCEKTLLKRKRMLIFQR